MICLEVALITSVAVHEAIIHLEINSDVPPVSCWLLPLLKSYMPFFSKPQWSAIYLL